MYICMCVCMYVCMYVYVSMYVSMYVCMYVSINLIELTICWDTNFNNAEARKTNRYQELAVELSERNWKVNLITLKIGSRGFTSSQTASKLKYYSQEKA